MTSESHLSNEAGTLVAMTGRNPIHANSLSFPDNPSASYHFASHQMSPALQPDTLTATLSSSNDIGAPTVAPATNANGWATKQDWARHQVLIKQLYVDGKKRLAEVMRVMESQHGFKATDKMYKTQIKRWGLDKKNKEFEMRAIVLKSKQRADQGKKSIIHVRGQPRDFEEVVRYWNRKGVSIDDLIARQTTSPTPEAVEIFTPVPSPPMTPQVLVIPERMFRCIRDYFRGSFESGTWVKTEPHDICYSIKDEENAAGVSLYGLNLQFLLACSLFDRNMSHEAGQTVIAATAQFKKVLLAEHPETLTALFWMVILVRDGKRDEMALILLRHFAALSKVLLGSEHPHSRICEWADSIYASGFDACVLRCMEVMADQFESVVGPMHVSTLDTRMKLIRMARKGNSRIKVLQDLLHECENTLRPYDFRVLNVRADLATEYFNGSYYNEAWTLNQRNIACSQHIHVSPEVYLVSLYSVALCQYAFGEVDSGIETLHTAIELETSRRDLQNCRARLWLIQLEDWYLEQNHWSSAVQVRDWREKLRESMDED